MFFNSDDDDSLSCGDIIYVEESPSELVSLEEENDEEIDTEIQDKALRETLLNVNLLISKIEAFNEKPISPPIPVEDSDLFSDESIPEFEAFHFDHMGEKISGSTTSHSHPPLPEYESFTFEEFAGELTHIDLLPPRIKNPINGLFEKNDLHHLLPEIESFSFEDFTVVDIFNSFLSEDKIFKPGTFPFEETHMELTPDKNLKLQTSSEELLILEYDYFDLKEDHSLGGDALIHENLHTNEKVPTLPPGMFSKPKSLTDKIQSSATALDPENEDLVMMVIMTFFLFFTYPVTSLLRYSFGNEDTIFDPGITAYSFYFLEIGVSHQFGTFTYFNVSPNILKESPMEIFSSTCFPKNQ